MNLGDPSNSSRTGAIHTTQSLPIEPYEKSSRNISQLAHVDSAGLINQPIHSASEHMCHRVEAAKVHYTSLTGQT